MRFRSDARPRFLTLFLAFFLVAMPQLRAEEQDETTPIRVDRVEPPNWWVGMKHNRVQLMLHGVFPKDTTVTCDQPGVDVTGVHTVDNDHYLFVDIDIASDAEPASYRLEFKRRDISETQSERSAIVEFPIHQRESLKGKHQGFTTRDTIYLITPDRFSNGDPSNDRVAGILDDFDPSEDGKRHGGDLQGIINHLDYLQDLGITAIWLNPVLENNGINSYHGYKATNLYRIDPRFGSNELYKQLVTEAHDHGIKVIFDHISNHIGIRHPWIDDLPSPDWLNGSVKNHLSDKHFMLSLTDPHADPRAREQLKTFWFVDRMPDLNQRNPFLARYLIQNSIWWIEFSGLDGIREDTYPYADQEFLGNWAKEIREEYPNFKIVGEIWATKPAYIAQFQERTIFPRDFETHLPAVMDFPLMEAYRGFLDGTKRLRDVHAVYSQDFLYTDISNLLVFLDNHDTPRALYQAEENLGRVKLALTAMMCARGIPQILYGTEIGMLGGASHIELRANFPGGFPGDKRSAFSPDGRTAQEEEIHHHIRRLLRLRRDFPAITDGAMTHYAPSWHKDVYCFIRTLDDERILVVANGLDEAQTIDLREMLGGDVMLRDLMRSDSKTRIQVNAISLEPLEARVFELHQET